MKFNSPPALGLFLPMAGEKHNHTLVTFKSMIVQWGLNDAPHMLYSSSLFSLPLPDDFISSLLSPTPPLLFNTSPSSLSAALLLPSPRKWKQLEQSSSTLPPPHPPAPASASTYLTFPHYCGCPALPCPGQTPPSHNGTLLVATPGRGSGTSVFSLPHHHLLSLSAELFPSAYKYMLFLPS